MHNLIVIMAITLFVIYNTLHIQQKSSALSLQKQYFLAGSAAMSFCFTCFCVLSSMSVNTDTPCTTTPELTVTPLQLKVKTIAAKKAVTSKPKTTVKHQRIEKHKKTKRFNSKKNVFCDRCIVKNTDDKVNACSSCVGCLDCVHK